MSPDRAHVYVASSGDDAVAIFDRDGHVGARLRRDDREIDGAHLSYRGEVRDGVSGVAGAVGLALNANGTTLYVAGQYAAAVAVFERDPGTGLLTWVEEQTNGVGGVQGLDGVYALALSPDGEHLYTASRVDDAVAVFSCASDGTLTYLQVLRDGGAAEGLDQALAVAVSPDGEHVYATGANDGALAVLRRDADPLSDDFGKLSFVEVMVDGSGGIEGLAGARSVAVGTDGRNVYVAGEYDHSLAIFARNTDDGSPDFGTLAPVEVRPDGTDDVDGLAQAYAVAVSSDDRNVYVAGLADNAVAAFVRRTGSNCTASGTGDIDDTIDIGFGGVVTYTVEATIDPAATGTLLNTATVTMPDGGDDPDDTNDSAEDSTTLVPRTDLTISKTFSSLPSARRRKNSWPALASSGRK